MARVLRHEQAILRAVLRSKHDHLFNFRRISGLASTTGQDHDRHRQQQTANILLLHKLTTDFQTTVETTSMCEHTAPKEQSRCGDRLRSERRSARRQGRAEGKLPVTGQLRRRGCGKIVTNPSGPVNLHRRDPAIEQRRTDRHDEEQLILLREIAGGRQSATRVVAMARAGMRMFLRAAILLAEQARRIN